MKFSEKLAYALSYIQWLYWHRNQCDEEEIGKILKERLPKDIHPESLRPLVCSSYNLKELERNIPLDIGAKEELVEPYLPDIEALNEEIRQQRKVIATKLQGIIQALRGTEFETLEERRKAANEIQSILNKIDWSACCTTCGGPARIRVAKAIKYPDGAFQFVHVRRKKTTHQYGEKFPVFHIMPNDGSDTDGVWDGGPSNAQESKGSE